MTEISISIEYDKIKLLLVNLLMRYRNISNYQRNCPLLQLQENINRYNTCHCFSKTFYTDTNGKNRPNNTRYESSTDPLIICT